eukprot:466601-Amphidinium_carterae.1
MATSLGFTVNSFTGDVESSAFYIQAANQASEANPDIYVGCGHGLRTWRGCHEVTTIHKEVLCNSNGQAVQAQMQLGKKHSLQIGVKSLSGLSLDIHHTEHGSALQH